MNLITRDPAELAHLAHVTRDLERDAWTHLVRSADRPALEASDLSVTRIGRATALRCRAGGPLLNRAYGAAADDDLVHALVEHYAAAAVPLFFLQLDDPDRERCERVAARAGLVRYRRSMARLVRASAPVRTCETALEVDLATSAEMPRAARIFCAAFDADLSLAPVIASLHGSPRWRFVVARAGGVAVSLGVLYVDGDAGYLVGGATAPSYRGLGSQAALISARLQIAEALGCRVVATLTGEPVAGDPQHSYRNLLRNGFQLAGRTESYAPSGIVWTHGRRAAGAR